MIPLPGGVQDGLFFLYNFRSGCWGQHDCMQGMLQLWSSVCCPSASQGMLWIPPGGLALWGLACHSNGVPVAEVLCGGSLLAASHSLGDCCRTVMSLGIFFYWIFWCTGVTKLSFLSSVVSLTRDVLSLEKSVRNSHRILWFFSIQRSQALFQGNKIYIFIYGGHAINISHMVLWLLVQER